MAYFDDEQQKMKRPAPGQAPKFNPNMTAGYFNDVPGGNPTTDPNNRTFPQLSAALAPGGGGAAMGTTPGLADTTPRSNPGAGSGFVNFENYLSANHQAADRMANQVGAGVSRDAQAAQGAISSAEASQRAAIDAAKNASTAPTITKSGTQSQSIYQDAADGSKQYQGTVTAPTYTTTTAQYAGPTAYDPAAYTAAQGSLQKAQSSLNATATGDGLQALIQKGYGGNSSASGFDSMLVQGAGAQNNRFQKLRGMFSGLNTALPDSQARVNQYAKDAQADFNQRAASQATALTPASGISQATIDAQMAKREKQQAALERRVPGYKHPNENKGFLY